LRHVPRSPNPIQEDRIVKGLCQERDRAVSHSPKAHFLVTMRGYKYDRNLVIFSIQLRLQIDAGHARHSNIGNETTDILQKAKFEKFLG
jgi:hypothetical protein